METKELIEKLKESKNYLIVDYPLTREIIMAIIKTLQEYDELKRSPVVRFNKRKGEFKGVFPKA